MKKMAVTLSGCIMVLFAAGQETVQIIKEAFNRPGVQDHYSVLKSKKKIKHGPYKKVNGQGNIIATGFYKENKKDSIWEEYNYNGTKLFARGQYINDEKTGVWEYFGYDGHEQQKYDHTNNQLVFFKNHPKDSVHYIYNGNQLVKTALDQPPLLIGGSPVIQLTLLQNLRYPADAIRTQKTGTVVIGFDIDVDGQPGNYKVVESVHSSLDNEAIRVIKMIPKQWLPGIKDGQKVKVQIRQPVVFRLS